MLTNILGVGSYCTVMIHVKTLPNTETSTVVVKNISFVDKAF